jgi:prepilin-type N-terminal cleavage/methylation domain-containing protein
MLHNKKSFNGFTIIELLVVITVIGILAGIVSLSYSSWRTRTAQTEVSSDLNSVSAAMESARNFSSGYPATLPSTYTPSQNVTTILKSSTSTTYCAQATSTVVSSVVYKVTNANKTPVAGACP